MSDSVIERIELSSYEVIESLRSGESMAQWRNARMTQPAGKSPIARRELPDYLRWGLKVVFVGFNPGDRSSRIGHYYAGRGNQFWNCLYESGLVPEALGPEEDRRVLEFGIGLTDIVKRWSKSSGELKAADYRQGIPKLRAKLEQLAPRAVAFNGKGVYERFRSSALPVSPRRPAQPLRPVQLGLQQESLGGARVFVLPSTSGRNGRLTRGQKLRYFRELAQWVRRYGG